MGTIGTVQAIFQADTSGFDASLKSAVASLGQVGEQATAASQKVDAATRLQEAAAQRVRRVLAQVAAEQKSLASQPVSDGARKVAEATLAQSKAYTELHRVQGLVRSDAVDEATKTDLLAAAQSRAAETSATLAEAKQREGAAAELAGVREALAGQRVTEEALRTTAALRAQAEAQSLLNRAQGLVTGGLVAGPEGTQLVAAAQLRQVSAAAEVAAAKKAEAIAVAEAAREEALSQNVIVRAFQRVALAAQESLNSIKEKLMETAEAAGLQSEGISAGFAGLTKLFGAGIAVGFAAEYLDGLAKMNVELDHLATKTGIDIQQLAGLQEIVKEMGGEWDPVTLGLVRMQRAQVATIESGKNMSSAQGKAFHDLGISMKELEHMSPEQLFIRVGTAIAHIQQPAIATAAAMAIFGRGGAALIPIFKEQGDQLEANMTKTGKMTGITDKSAEAARRWTADVAKLSAEFRSVMMPVMEHAEDAVKGIGGVFMAAFTAVDAVFETAAAGVVALVQGVGTLGKVLYDLAKGDYFAASQDVSKVKDRVTQPFKDAFGEIASEGKKTYALFTEVTPTPPSMPGAEDPDLAGLERPEKGPKSHAAEKAAQAQMQDFEHGASVLEEQGNADAFTIHGYWSKKIEAMQKGSADYDKVAGNLNYDKIYAKLAESTKRMDAELEKSLHPKKDEAAGAFEREQERAADESAKRVAEIRQRASDEQGKLQEKAQLSDVSIALSHGEISRYQALVAEAQIHAASFGAEIAEVEKRLADAEAMHSLPGMDEEIAKRQAQLAQLKAQAGEQAQLDASAISSQTIGGAFHDALNEWVQQSNDAAALVRKTFTEAASGINEDLAKALTDPARTQYERMQNLKAGLAGTARGIANQGITFGLGKLESTLPGELGKIFGGGKKPTGAKGDPLYVAFDGMGAGGSAAGRAAGVAASVNQSIRGAGAGGDEGGLDRLLNLPVPHAVVSGPDGYRGGSGAGPSIASGAGDIFSSFFPAIGGTRAPQVAAPAVASGVGDIFNSFLPALGGTHAGTPQAAADFSSATATSSGSTYLDALASLAPQGKISSTVPGFTDGRGSPYTAADISMQQPDAMQPQQQSPFVSMTAPPQQSPLVSTTRPKQSGIGSMVQSLVGMGLKLIPGFETGGPIAPDMGSFIVGESGPELLNIGSTSAHVTPNHQLKSYGGGDTHHHWAPGAIDASGSTNPAQTAQMVRDGILQAAPMIARMGMQGTKEDRLRRPTTSH